MPPREHGIASSSGDSLQLEQLAMDLEHTRAAIDLWQYAVLKIPVDGPFGPTDTKLVSARARPAPEAGLRGGAH
jgi:hypothetical protein